MGWKLRLAELACERASEASGQVRCPALPAGQFSTPAVLNYEKNAKALVAQLLYEGMIQLKTIPS
jgi:hypothetical protein